MSAPAEAGAGRGRLRAARVLVVVGSVLAFLGVFAIWVERQALDTDDWVETSSRLWRDPAIRAAVSDYIVDQLEDDAELEAEVEGLLPDFADGIAEGLADGVGSAARAGTETVLDSAAATGIWEGANRTAHEQLVAVLEDRSDLVSTGGGDVVLELRGVLVTAAEEVGVGVDLAEEVPADAGRIEIAHSDQLLTAQRVVGWIKGLALALTILSLACFALAIRVARGSRARIVGLCGVGLFAAGAATLLFRFVAGKIVVDALVRSDNATPAAEAAWSIGTSVLASIAVIVIVIGAGFFVGGFLASDRKTARRVRRLIGRALRGPGADPVERN